LELQGDAGHRNHREDNDDYYNQPGNLYRMMSSEQQKVLCENTGRAIGDAPKKIKVLHITNCMKADHEYGKCVAKALDISMDEIAG
jgi:catalase